MTQPGAPVTQGELMRLLVQQVPALTRRSVQVPSKRLGSVESVDEGVAQVTLDGDAAAVSIQVAVPGGVSGGRRVVVDFYPPHGALVTGVLGPSTGTTLSGLDAGTIANGTAGDDNVAVAYGSTFTVAPIVVATAVQADNIDLVVNIEGLPSTTGFVYRVITKDGTNVAGDKDYGVSWMAHGTLE